MGRANVMCIFCDVEQDKPCIDCSPAEMVEPVDWRIERIASALMKALHNTSSLFGGLWVGRAQVIAEDIDDSHVRVRARHLCDMVATYLYKRELDRAAEAIAKESRHVA